MKALALKAMGISILAAILGCVFGILGIGVPGWGLWGLLAFVILCCIVAAVTKHKAT